MLVDTEEPVSPPAHARKPGPGRRHGRGPDRAGDCRPPSREPRCRRPCIEPACPGQVLSPILEHVHESVAHLARRPQKPRVVAVAPHASGATERTVHRLRHPDGQPLDASPDAAGPVRLDEEMNVVSLDAEMKQPEDIAGGGGQRSAHGPK